MDFARVLDDELRLIGSRRRQIRALAPRPPDPPPADGDGGVMPEPRAPQDTPTIEGTTGGATTTASALVPVGAGDPQKQARLRALDRHLAGLAISGGGIRSATFALGVLQGLADLKLLSRFDYLSTVSGGGYIGGWLTAWIKRQGDPMAVEKQLSPSRIVEARSDPIDPLIRSPLPEKRIVDEEPEPIHHLRSYSNYLTPRPGLLSVDTWTVLTIYVRNALINLLLLLPVTMLAVLAGLAIVWFYTNTGTTPASRGGIFAILVVALVVAFSSMGLHVYYILDARVHPPGDDERSGRRAWMRVTMPATILAPLMVAAVTACWSFTPMPARPIVAAGGPPGGNAAPLRLPLPVLRAAAEQAHARLAQLTASVLSESRLRTGSQAVESDLLGALAYPAVAYGLAFGVPVLLVHLCGYVVYYRRGLDPDSIARCLGQERSRLAGVLWMSMSAFIAGFNGGFFFFAVLSLVLWRFPADPYFAITVGPPLILLVVVGATFVEVWLLGRWEGDDLREWWARICAWLVILAAAWLTSFAIALYGPLLIFTLVHRPVGHGLALGWLATAAGGAWAGRRPESLPNQGSGVTGFLIKLLVAVAPTVFVIGLLVAVGMIVDVLVFDSLPVAAAPAGGGAGAVVQADPYAFLDSIKSMSIRRILGVGGICIFLASVAAAMSNVNLFSLNSMYAERLIRCYLGASRPKRSWTDRGAAWATGAGGAPTGVAGAPRSANSVTGFDPNDDIPLREMAIVEGRPGGGPPAPGTYVGPHHIINTALNLVAGHELAWQDRKAESFVLTPTHCGSATTGYAPTSMPTARELTLGRAMSISGAAVDSNIGLHQSSALIALMTAFNARLGWWIRNPNAATWKMLWLPWKRKLASSGWDAGSPSLALPLLLELVGITDDKKEYVHLSDGGHFENLAVYELVRRRCRYIVCCDAGTDPGASDDSLANMIRLCRTDFGVRIELDTGPFARLGPDSLSRWHCAVGRIRYDDVDDGERPGIFVYMRTSMTGDEPPDVQQYAATNPTFPFETTLDQFFDEPQFESYRALGFHVAETAFKEALGDVTDNDPLWSYRDAEQEFRRGNQRLFSAMQRRWSPSPPDDDHAARRTLDSWGRLQEALRQDGELAALVREIYPELATSAADGPGVPEVQAVAQLIQVMEDAWLDLKQSGFRDLPMNRGWMAIFRRWSSTPALRRLWPILRGEYRQDFVKFCEDELELRARIDAVARDDVQLDAGFVAESLRLLGEEFSREWPFERPMAELVADAERNWPDWAGAGARPISLLIQAPPGGGSVAASAGKVACGIVFLTRVAAADDAKQDPGLYDIFIWLRRPYRGLAIASRCARKILTGFREMLPDGMTRRVIFQARYPAQPGETSDTRKEEADFVLWLSFFGHYDFRFPRGEPRIRGGYWVVTLDERTLPVGVLEP